MRFLSLGEVSLALAKRKAVAFHQEVGHGGHGSQIGWYRECGYGITKAVGISQERSPYPLPSFSAVHMKCFREKDISNGICEMVQEWGNIIRDIAPNVIDALQWDS